MARRQFRVDFKVHDRDMTTRSNRKQQHGMPQAQAAPPPPQHLQAMQTITFAPVEVAPTPIVATAAVGNPPVVDVQMANRDTVLAQNAARNTSITYAPQATTTIQHAAYAEGQLPPQGPQSRRAATHAVNTNGAAQVATVVYDSQRPQARIKSQTTRAANVVARTTHTPVEKNSVGPAPTLVEQAPTAGSSGTTKSSNKAHNATFKATQVVGPSTTTPDTPVDNATTPVKPSAPSKTTKAAGPAKETKDRSTTSAAATASVNNTAVPSGAASASTNVVVASGRDTTPSTTAAPAHKSTQVATPAKTKGDTSVTAVVTTALADRTPADQASTIVDLNENTTDNATAATPQSVSDRPFCSLPRRAATNQETSSSVQKAKTSQPQHAKTTEKPEVASNTPRKSTNPATPARASDAGVKLKEDVAEIAQTAPVSKATPPVTNAPAAETATPTKANGYHAYNENEPDAYPTTPNSKKRKADTELTPDNRAHVQRPRSNLAHYQLAPEQQTLEQRMLVQEEETRRHSAIAEAERLQGPEMMQPPNVQSPDFTRVDPGNSENSEDDNNLFSEWLNDVYYLDSKDSQS